MRIRPADNMGCCYWIFSWKKGNWKKNRKCYIFLALNKSCHTGPLLKAFNVHVHYICGVIHNKVLALYNQIFSICNQHLYEVNCFYWPGFCHIMSVKKEHFYKMADFKLSSIKAALNSIKFVSDERVDRFTGGIKDIAFDRHYLKHLTGAPKGSILLLLNHQLANKNINRSF